MRANLKGLIITCFLSLLVTLLLLPNKNSPVIEAIDYPTDSAVETSICDTNTKTTNSEANNFYEITVEAENSFEATIVYDEFENRNFIITVYTPYSDNGRWGYNTATMVKSQHLKTCAVDPNVIPLGSTVEINGLTLKAVDTGSEVKGCKIDIFYDGSDEDARRWLENEFGTSHTIKIIN